MNIGIDARMYGPHVGGGGLGRYVEQLVTQLQAIDHKNRYVLFLKKENFDACQIVNPNFEKRLVDIHWYTAKEQFELGRAMDAEHLDLIHFPHWNVPVFLKTPYLVTIHDLILLDEPVSSNLSTKNPLLFYLKYIAYRCVLARTISRARHIITVSHATEASIHSHFPRVNKEKISVVYEGVTQLTTDPLRLPLGKGEVTGPYLLYVGNAYPHKNLERLIEAFGIIRTSHPEIKLVLAGRESMFYERLEAGLGNPAYSNILFLKNPSDLELANLYQNALVYVYPSRIEGFGLPPFEAMSMDIPVAASDIPSLREILGESAAFFPPNDSEKMAQVISHLIEDEQARNHLIAKGSKHIQQFSFEKMAKHILATYELCGKTK